MRMLSSLKNFICAGSILYWNFKIKKKKNGSEGGAEALHKDTLLGKIFLRSRLTTKQGWSDFKFFHVFTAKSCCITFYEIFTLRFCISSFLLVHWISVVCYYLPFDLIWKICVNLDWPTIQILCKYRGCFVKLINWVKANSKTETFINNIFIPFYSCVIRDSL